jgi:hypothetical protein
VVLDLGRPNEQTFRLTIGKADAPVLGYQRLPSL